VVLGANLLKGPKAFRIQKDAWGNQNPCGYQGEIALVMGGRVR